MDRTGKRHMARRADDCKPNLEGNRPACSAVVGVLDYKGSPINSRLCQFGLPISASLAFFYQRRPDLSAVRGPPFILPLVGTELIEMRCRLPRPQLACSTAARITRE
jgi:hypothetical protein